MLPCAQKPAQEMDPEQTVITECFGWLVLPSNPSSARLLEKKQQHLCPALGMSAELAPRPGNKGASQAPGALPACRARSQATAAGPGSAPRPPCLRLRKQFLPRRQGRAGEWKITAGFFLKGKALRWWRRLGCSPLASPALGELFVPCEKGCSASGALRGVRRGRFRLHGISAACRDKKRESRKLSRREEGMGSAARDGRGKEPAAAFLNRFSPQPQTWRLDAVQLTLAES